MSYSAAEIQRLRDKLIEARKQRDGYQRLWHRDADLLRQAFDVLTDISDLEYDDPELEGFQAADDARDLASDMVKSIREARQT